MTSVSSLAHAGLCLGALLLTACGAFTRAAPAATTAAGPASAAPVREGAALTVRAPSLPPRQELPFEAREMLESRMLRHGQEMTALMVGVLLLDYDLSYTYAASFADEPKLGRPAVGEKGTLSALLPAEFFVHQDTLGIAARQLAAASLAKDDARMVDAFAAVAKSCVGCHSAYLHDDLNILEHDEPGDGLPACDEQSEACDGGYESERKLDPAAHKL